MVKINRIDKEKKQTMKTGNTGRKQVQMQGSEKPQGSLRKRTLNWTQGRLVEPKYVRIKDICLQKRMLGEYQGKVLYKFSLLILFLQHLSLMETEHFALCTLV